MSCKYHLCCPSLSDIRYCVRPASSVWLLAQTYASISADTANVTFSSGQANRNKVSKGLFYAVFIAYCLCDHYLDIFVYKYVCFTDLSVLIFIYVSKMCTSMHAVTLCKSYRFRYFMPLLFWILKHRLFMNTP